MVERRRFLPLLVLAAVALLTACGKDTPPPAGPKTIDDRFAIQLGDRTVQVQLALLPSETQKGLMFRKELGPEEGMLFVFDRPQHISFWMRNTYIPLDAGYLDADGVLREVYPLYPHDERPVVSRGRMVFVLEMNQGWFRHYGVKPGAQLDLKAVTAAIRARGFNPASFGLR